MSTSAERDDDPVVTEVDQDVVTSVETTLAAFLRARERVKHLVAREREGLDLGDLPSMVLR